MLYKKQGFPEESEIVLCTVLKVHHNTVFMLLDEYDKKGIIHISEISPGRIRNLRDYVVEGKKVICKVLRIDETRGHIDLSLRRVNTMQRREKNSQIKQEQKAEKMLEFAAKEAGKSLKEVYDKIRPIVFSKYPSLYACFEDIVAENFSVSDLKLDPKISNALEELIKTRIKPPEVMIRGLLKLETYDPEGVELIKEILKKAEAENITIKYAGAGSYTIAVKAEDYKTAETDLKNATDMIDDFMNKHQGSSEFIRQEA
ncbi:translation initiation factor IF-2 subunit alpha [Candidatus Woesearchaeota archaeon]|nr:translation initiation factor IF-2 subunit alpha [Candidatus Woesearchaeota archaeon]